MLVTNDREPTTNSPRGYPHPEWAQLRQTAPIERFEPDGWPPFWAITRHADIVQISKNPQSFLNVDGIHFEPLSAPKREDSDFMGAHLARKSSAALFREFVSRVEEIEQIGDDEQTVSNLVPGLKHLPIRYRMSPRG